MESDNGMFNRGATPDVVSFAEETIMKAQALHDNSMTSGTI